MNESQLNMFQACAETVLAGTNVTRVSRASNFKNFVSLVVKTSRAPFDCYDYEALGVTPPDQSTNFAVEALAAAFSLRFVNFEPCEKGYGTLYFEEL